MTKAWWPLLRLHLIVAASPMGSDRDHAMTKPPNVTVRAAAMGVMISE
jgi:hypothetical protein